MITYNPELSIKENAKNNNVSEASIRLFIKEKAIDRRHERKINLIKDCQRYLKEHPKATWAELQKETGHSLSTMRKYRKNILSNTPIEGSDKKISLATISNNNPGLQVFGVVIVNGKTYKIESICDLQIALNQCRKEKKGKAHCFPTVYLMKDESIPDVTKIGRSKELFRREHTLQADKPTITLFKYLKFETEQEAKKHEKFLHKKYEKYMVKRKDNKKSEWFRLPQEELNELLKSAEWIDANQDNK